MPIGPTRISTALSNLAVQYTNNEYIFGTVFKDLPVAKESNQYWIWGNDFRIPETERANGALAAMATMGYSTSSYVVKEHAIKDVITDRDRENSDAPINLDRDMTENLTDIIMRRMEYEGMKLLFTTTSWSNNATLTSVTSWKGHTTTASPTKHVLSATGKILADSGKKANTIVMGWSALEALKENQNVWERIKYSERAVVTTELLAALFDIQNVYVGSAVYDSAKEGDTASKGFIWGSDAMVAYVDPSPGVKKATAWLNFRCGWKGNPYRVKKWREEEIEGDYIEVQTMCAPKPVATACAYLFKTVAL
jgi:hypothetical protein